jgi:hypothetical protein
MEANERAEILLKKYSLGYIKQVVNSTIKNARKNDEIEVLNHWNEISLIIKEKLNANNRTN